MFTAEILQCTNAAINYMFNVDPLKNPNILESATNESLMDSNRNLGGTVLKFRLILI